MLTDRKRWILRTHLHYAVQAQLYDCDEASGRWICLVEVQVRLAIKYIEFPKISEIFHQHSEPHLDTSVYSSKSSSSALVATTLSHFKPQSILGTSSPHLPPYIMGLIKTAIMTGGGIYAVNKLAKTVDHRRDSPQPSSNQYPRDNNQGSWGPPSPPPQRQPQADNYYYGDNAQRGGYPSNAQGYPPQQQQQQQRGYNSADSAGDKVAYDEEGWQYRPTNPPPYASQQQQQQGYPAQARGNGQYEGQGRGSQLEGLANMAMGFLGNGEEKGKKGKKLDKYFRD